MNDTNMSNAEPCCALGLNNLGAFHIVSANYMEAIKTLSWAHQVARKGFDQNREAISKGVSRCSFDKLMTESDDLVSKNDKCKVESQAYVYRRPIQLPENMKTDNASAGTVSVAIIFNLAIAHHLCGLTSSERRLQMLQKASKLYQYSCMLHLKQQEQSKQHSALLLMATNNNLGQVYQILGQLEAAEMCYRELLSALMYFHGHHNRNALLIEGFYQSTSYWLSKSFVAAAAAA